MQYVYGPIYSKGRFRTGHIGFENGQIRTTGYRTSARIKTDAVAKGLIIPSVQNCHTHLADSFLYGEVHDATIQRLVAPRSGLKMKRLRTATDDTIIKAARQNMIRMVECGTSAFVEFRELGLRGIDLFNKSAAELPIKHRLLGRPDGLYVDKQELARILEVVDGIGLSARRDWQDSAIDMIATETHRRNKLFAIHVSEVENEDIDDVLELKPDLMVHLLCATGSDMERIAERGIPVTICPRSNLFFGKYPAIRAMLDAGLILTLGTDNAMISEPYILAEMAAAFRIAKLSGGMLPYELLSIAFHNPRAIFDPGSDLASEHFETGKVADFTVLQIPDLDSYAHIEHLLCLGVPNAVAVFVSMNGRILTPEKRLDG